MREHVQSKLNNMASILLDDIIVPEQEEQSGSETIQASYYDKNGNRFTFTLSLNVTPKEKAETVDPMPTTQEQLDLILTKLALLESEVSDLKGYHQTDAPGEDTQEESG